MSIYVHLAAVDRARLIRIVLCILSPSLVLFACGNNISRGAIAIAIAIDECLPYLSPNLSRPSISNVHVPRPRPLNNPHASARLIRPLNVQFHSTWGQLKYTIALRSRQGINAPPVRFVCYWRTSRCTCTCPVPSLFWSDRWRASSLLQCQPSFILVRAHTKITFWNLNLVGACASPPSHRASLSQVALPHEAGHFSYPARECSGISIRRQQLHLEPPQIRARLLWGYPIVESFYHFAVVSMRWEFASLAGQFAVAALIRSLVGLKFPSTFVIEIKESSSPLKIAAQARYTHWVPRSLHQPSHKFLPVWSFNHFPSNNWEL